MTLLPAWPPPLVVLPVLGRALLLPSELGSPLGQPWPKPSSSAKQLTLPGSSHLMMRLAHRCAAERSGRR